MDNEPGAIQGWSDALTDFFSTMNAGTGVIVLPSAVELASQSLFGAMVGMSSPGVAPKKIQDGITAFWLSLVAQGPLVFTGFAAVKAPPTLPSIAALVTTAGMASSAAGLEEAAANNTLALAIYGACQGGLATPLTGPPDVPIT